MTTVYEDREIDITDITLAGTDVIVKKIRQLRFIDQDNDGSNQTAILIAVRASGGTSVSLTTGAFKYTTYDDADKNNPKATTTSRLGATGTEAHTADDWPGGSHVDVDRRTLGDFGYRANHTGSGIHGCRLTAATNTDTWYLVDSEFDTNVPADEMDYFKLEWEA